MRTEAEVKEALSHLEDAAISPEAAEVDPVTLAMLHASRDMMRWVLGYPNTLFARGVMDPCRSIDRAERQ